jgi:hypothetical protein
MEKKCQLVSKKGTEILVGMTPAGSGFWQWSHRAGIRRRPLKAGDYPYSRPKK